VVAGLFESRLGKDKWIRCPYTASLGCGRAGASARDVKRPDLVLMLSGLQLRRYASKDAWLGTDSCGAAEPRAIGRALCEAGGEES